jgi:FdhD protein
VRRAEAPIAWEETRDTASGLVKRLDVRLDDADVAHETLGRRALLATASCGLCGAREAADIELIGEPLVRPADERLDPARIEAMMEAMRAAQETFDASGGSHAAAAFTLAGERLAQSEDIGRHNAVDKVVGRLLLEGGAAALARARCLTVSGRLSYEIVAKAYRAGIPFVLAVSAPSALAVTMGERLGLTIVAFCRGPRATVYAHGKFVEASAKN